MHARRVGAAENVEAQKHKDDSFVKPLAHLALLTARSAGSRRNLPLSLGLFLIGTGAGVDECGADCELGFWFWFSSINS